MNLIEPIPDGISFIESADQWHEDGYVFKDDLVYSYFIDRKDPQTGAGEGRCVTDFWMIPM